MLAGVLVAAFLLQSFFASRVKSPVFDEPPHIASGLSYLETGVFHANLQHPPLLKEMAAVFLSLAGVHWPSSPMARKVTQGGPDSKNLEWQVGFDIIRSNGPDRVMFWARLPFILMAALLGVLIYVWGRVLVGDLAALGALFLYAFDPTIIAHSYLVTTDVGLAAFTMLFLFALSRYVQDPSRLRLIFCGLALGAVLGTKFSAVVLLPVGAILLAVAVWRQPVQVEAKPVGPNSPCPCGSGKKYKKCHGARAGGKVGPSPVPALRLRRLLPYAGACLAMSAIAAVVIEALYFFSSDPFLYITGMRLVNADHAPDYLAYFHGELAPRFLTYFANAYLLKEPVASIALVVFGLVVVLRSKTTDLQTKLLLFLPPVAFFLAYTIYADQFGIRYIIPTLPFAFLIGGTGMALLVRTASLWSRALAVVLCLWMAVEAAGIYPDHLSYFNEMACALERPGEIGLDGGTRCGPLWLDDSNVDWGQSLKQLQAWVEKHGEKRTIRLAYFGSFPPENYGLQYQKIGLGDLLPQPAPGLYAVSAHLVARYPAMADRALPGAGAWLRQTPPTAIVGHAIYIYDVPPKS